MSDRPELKQSPGSRDSENPWTPPHNEPTKHDETRIQAPDVKQDLDTHTPGQLGGKPSVGWQTEDE